MSGIAALGLMVAAGTAHAQHSNETDGPGPSQYVTTVDGHKIQHKRIETSFTSTAYPTEEISLSQPVSYADLDLKTFAGVNELKYRVRMAAEQTCDELDRIYPQTNSAYGGDPSVNPDKRICLMRTEDKADRAVDRLVRVANE